MYDRERIFEREDWSCVRCERFVLTKGLHPQIAHRIPNTKSMRRRYGDEVIDHELNVALVCCLDCNNAIQLTNKPREAEELAERIKEDLQCNRNT